jgi:hypothetical protein
VVDNTLRCGPASSLPAAIGLAAAILLLGRLALKAQQKPPETAGAPVRVVGIRGLTMIVEPLHQSSEGAHAWKA